MTLPCALCGGTALRACLRHADGCLARCRACGLVRVEPLPSPEVALAQYDASYFRGDVGYRDYASEEPVFRAEFRRRLSTMRAAGARGRLLDVGAASGALLAEAHAAGFEVSGIEPAGAMAEVARGRGLGPVVCATVEAASLPPGSFDVVTCFDVIEHLVDPVAALRRLREWLVPAGLLALTVPDFGGLWARGSGARWPFVTPKEHLHYFTRRTLARALRAAGFSRPTFPHAGTAVSLGSIARRAPGPLGPWLDRRLGRLGNSGFSLPFGTIFSLSRTPDASSGANSA